MHPDGWHKEYIGYIMSGSTGHCGGSIFNCIDENMEQVKSSGGFKNVCLLYLVGADRSHIHTTGYALYCVVCTK